MWVVVSQNPLAFYCMTLMGEEIIWRRCFLQRYDFVFPFQLCWLGSTSLISRFCIRQLVSFVFFLLLGKLVFSVSVDHVAHHCQASVQAGEPGCYLGLQFQYRFQLCLNNGDLVRYVFGTYCNLFLISLPPRNSLSSVLYIRLLIAIWRQRARRSRGYIISTTEVITFTQI